MTGKHRDPRPHFVRRVRLSQISFGQTTAEPQACFERFCEALVPLHSNAYRAAIKAGYSRRMAKSKRKRDSAVQFITPHLEP
jgi:hypothetical protein